MSDKNIDKHINRCKELIKEEHSNWIGLTNQEAIENVLSEFQGVRNIATSTLIDNANLQAELETYKKIAELMTNEIFNLDIVKALYNKNRTWKSEEEIKEYFINVARKEVENES